MFGLAFWCKMTKKPFKILIYRPISSHLTSIFHLPPFSLPSHFHLSSEPPPRRSKRSRSRSRRRRCKRLAGANEATAPFCHHHAAMSPTSVLHGNPELTGVWWRTKVLEECLTKKAGRRTKAFDKESRSPEERSSPEAEQRGRRRRKAENEGNKGRRKRRKQRNQLYRSPENAGRRKTQMRDNGYLVFF